MARKPSVRYWDSRKGYCVKVRGVQHLLASGPDDSPHGPTFLAALDAFRRLLEKDNLDTIGDGNTVRAILDAYLVDAERRVQPNTFDLRLRHCRLFSARHGTLPVAQVKPYHATELIDPAWKPGSARLYLVSLRAGFNWAVRQELITKNPLRFVHMPTADTGARERTLQPGEWEVIMGALAQKRHINLRWLVIALRASGARPGELTQARVDDWHDHEGCIIHYRDGERKPGHYRHKTARQKTRQIYFVGGELGMLRQLVKGKRGSEPLFPTRVGTRYGRHTLTACFRRIRERTGFDWLTPYTFRHTLATDWILAGRSVEILANLLGNTPAVIQRHYSHLLNKHDDMRRQLEEFRGT